MATLSTGLFSKPYHLTAGVLCTLGEIWPHCKQNGRSLSFVVLPGGAFWGLSGLLPLLVWSFKILQNTPAKVKHALVIDPSEVNVIFCSLELIALCLFPQRSVEYEPQNSQRSTKPLKICVFEMKFKMSEKRYEYINESYWKCLNL